MNIFEQLNLTNDLVKAIAKLGITVPTEIQALSLPPIMEGKDVVGESATGSGKTLAFGCGIINKVIPGQGLQALVLTPTRELAEQVKESLIKLSLDKKLNIISIYGGVAIEPQMRDLKRADIVVATPGRFLDHMSQRTVNTSQIKILVLDEADRMLDMGFIDDVQKIIKVCPNREQTLFFSATISSQIKKLAQQFMKEPVNVSAKSMVDPSKLKQVYYDVPRSLRLALLIHLLKGEKRGLVMVFCNTRMNTDFVVKNLEVNGVNAIAIHGGFTQNKRTKTMEMFNNAKVGVLVCTDVAARGLHIDNVSHVYNYDLPKDPKDYIHRIGRTARAGEDGKVINLLSDVDHDNFSRILRDYRDMKVTKEERPYLEKVKMVQVERRSFGGRGGPRRGGNNRGPRRDGPRRGGPKRGNSGPRRGGPRRPSNNQRRD